MLDNTNPEISEGLANGTMTEAEAAVSYNYTWPLVMLACLGVAALLIGIWLKIIDKKQNLGLELPNIQNPEVGESEILAAEE